MPSEREKGEEEYANDNSVNCDDIFVYLLPKNLVLKSEVRFVFSFTYRFFRYEVSILVSINRLGSLLPSTIVKLVSNYLYK